VCHALDGGVIHVAKVNMPVIELFLCSGHIGIFSWCLLEGKGG